MRPLLNARRPPPLAGLLPLKPHRCCHPYHLLFSSIPTANAGVVRPLAAMAKTVDESGLGISCFVSSLPGFHAVLKHRYSDFIVNEVGLDGHVVHLTSFDLPEELGDWNHKRSDIEELESCSNRKDYTMELEVFRTLCGEADVEALGLLLQNISSAESDILPIVLSPDSDKSHRAEVHNFFKWYFKFLVTDTVEEPKGGSKSVRVRFIGDREVRKRKGKKRKDRNNDRPFDSRGSENWPETRGKFLRFNLYKENKDTQEVLGVIGKMLGIQQRAFGFAGTKDKCSISTQRVTIFKVHAKRLAVLNSRLFGIKVGDFCYVKEGLVLGQLLGNRFTIILRNVIADSEDIIKAAVDGLGKSGFINYYGLQRFGSGSVPTHFVGATLLRGEWKDSASLILDPREGERENIREARQHYREHGDIDLALRKLPGYLVAERAVLQYLKKCPGNYLQALQSIPRTLRMIYVHSYQSYLWNHAASMRVQKYGFSQVVLGDLVFCKEDRSTTLASTDDSETEDNSNDVDNSLFDFSDEAFPEEKIQFVKVVDSDDLLKGVYTIEDVILPLPGSRILYPENDIANVYHDMAKKDGISLTESIHGVKDFSITNMKGGYRHLFKRPMDFTWELLTYTEDTIRLVETDLDIRNNKCQTLTKGKILDNENRTKDEKMDVGGSLGELIMENQIEGTSSKVESASTSVFKSPMLALKLSFTLPASCYATMAIRELLKTSTSVNLKQ